MMKNLLPLLILLIPQLTSGQDYPGLLSNSGWCCEQFFGTGAIYSEFYVSGDTMIGERLYRVINEQYYLYEDPVSKQVWYLNRGENELLYDFSLEQNDTFSIQLYDTVIGSFQITQVDYIATLSGNRKRWVMNLIDSAVFQDGRIVEELIWIEGIGSTYGPIYPTTIPFINDFGGAGTCVEGVYSKEKEQIYQGYCTYIGGYHPEYCRFISSVADRSLNPVSARFNASGSLQFDSDYSIEHISIFDLSGRQVHHSGYSGEKEIQISNHWPVGIYLCKIVFINSEIRILKLTKNY
jgi:hypothetical protein